jgi:glutathione S-transferase
MGGLAVIGARPSPSVYSIRNRIMPLQLYIGNKNYSSWSMRPWVLMRQTGIEFTEVMVRFDAFDPGSKFKTTLQGVTPTGKVPVLVDDDVVVWDTLAISEYLAEQHPSLQLWPADAAARARARSVCAEMHSGFTALRQNCPMNIEAHLPEAGRAAMQKPEVQTDVQRLVALWDELLQQHGGPMLLGAFGIADAFFAPVAMRVHTYELPVSSTSAAYLKRLRKLPGVQAWIDQALLEADFRPFEEPYRHTRDKP